MIITGNFRINTFEAEEKQVFAVMKQFLTEQFQDYEFEVSGKDETLRHKQEKIEIEETKELIKEKKSEQNTLGRTANKDLRGK